MANFSASSVHGTKTTAGVLNFLLSHVYHTGHSFSFTTEAAMQRILCFVCNNTTQQQSFYGPLSRTTRRTRVSRYQKKHSPTHHPEHHPIFIIFFHLLRSIASSLFNTCLTIFLHNLSPSPLWSTSWSGASYSIHFFIQSMSSFCNTCPHHRNLFCYSSKIISPIPSHISTLYEELYLLP